MVSFPLTVDGGDSIAVPIRFQPTNRGSATAMLTIVSNDPNSPAVVNVSGTAWPPLPIAGTALDGYRLSNDSQHVNYIGTDKHVHELYITAGAAWVDNDLTELAGAVPPIATSALEGFRLSDDSQHVFFIGTDDHVYELYITAGAGWVYNDLTALARAVPPTPTTALDGYRLSDDSKHVFFIGTDNHVHELYIARGGRWVDNDLTTLAGAVFHRRPPAPWQLPAQRRQRARLLHRHRQSRPRATSRRRGLGRQRPDRPGRRRATHPHQRPGRLPAQRRQPARHLHRHRQPRPRATSSPARAGSTTT